MLRFFAVAAPGIEPFVRQELVDLGIATFTAAGKQLPGEPDDENGGIEFEGELNELYRANLNLRTSNRVLVRLGDFYAAAFSELRKKAARLPWETYIRPGQTIAVRVTCHRSRLYHSDGVAERITAAIGDHLGQPAKFVKIDENENQLPQLIIVRLVHDHCTVSIDSTGAQLHRRGYRLETAKAPLRETLAAAMLMASGWDKRAPLIDPFCGSGTIPIEADWMARKIAPGKQRRFACMDWPGYDSAIWQTELDRAAECEGPTNGTIMASDRDAGAIRIAQANAGRASVLEDIEFSCKAFSAIEPSKGNGWIVTNPPYGVRLTPDHDLRNLYSQLGNVLRAHCPGWNVAILCSSDYLIGHAHLGLSGRFSFVNGGLQVKLFTGKIKRG